MIDQLKNIVEGVERPTCFGRFTTQSEFCNKVCKHAKECIDYRRKKEKENEIPPIESLQGIE